MCKKNETFEDLSNEQLLRDLERAIVLETKHSGNGQNPFDTNGLRMELLRRLNKKKT